MTPGAIRLVLTGWGAAATAALAVGLVRADALASMGPGWTLTFLATFIVGVWACRAQPDNPAAVRLLVFGCAALTFLAVSVAQIIEVRSGVVGTRFVLGNVVAQMASLMFVCTQVAALVRYPDGVARQAVERWLVGALAVITLLLPPLLLLTHSDVVPAWIVGFSSQSDGLVVPVVASPWYVEWLGWLGPVTGLLNDSLLAIGPLLGVGVAAARYRHLDAVRRHQMGWPMLAGLLLILGVAVNALAEAGAMPRLWGDVVQIVTYILLPLSMGIGIVTPGIFDALGSARRTVSFAALSSLIFGLYIAIAGLLGLTVGGQDLRVAVFVAILAALALEPVRRTLVRRAGWLTFGHEVPRDELLLRLGDTLEHTMDRRALTTSIAETAMEGLGAQWVLLEPEGGPAVHVGRPIREGEKPAVSARLLHGHDDLGVISCGPAISGGIHTRSRIQLETLARQVAMALTNARLADELNEQLIEVDASRQRLVTAEDTARRRLERDLHDGAQQDLAALLTRIALARNQLGRADVDRLDQTLATLHTEAADTLNNLRQLVSGIHEKTLADQGLVAAIEGRITKMPIPVAMMCTPAVRDNRFPAMVESTAYFSVCEALANTLKHARAGQATIAMDLQNGRLRIDIADDGQGFDPAQVNGATGLTGLRDRVQAVGGTLQVRSSKAAGTTVTAIMPVRP